MTSNTDVSESQLYEYRTEYGNTLRVAVLEVDGNVAKVVALDNHPSDENKSYCRAGDETWIDTIELTPIE